MLLYCTVWCGVVWSGVCYRRHCSPSNTTQGRGQRGGWWQLWAWRLLVWARGAGSRAFPEVGVTLTGCGRRAGASVCPSGCTSQGRGVVAAPLAAPWSVPPPRLPPPRAQAQAPLGRWPFGTGPPETSLSGCPRPPPPPHRPPHYPACQQEEGTRRALPEAAAGYPAVDTPCTARSLQPHVPCVRTASLWS